MGRGVLRRVGVLLRSGCRGVGGRCDRQECRSTYVLSAEYKGTYHFEDHHTFQGQKLDSVETYTWDARGTETVKRRHRSVSQLDYT